MFWFGTDSPRISDLARALYPGSGKQAPAEERRERETATQRTVVIAAGLPPAKQFQQEETFVAVDEEERRAQIMRRMHQGAGRFATARPGTTSSAAASSSAAAIATGAAPTASYPKGCAGYSARGASNPGYLSPTRQRAQELTSRRQHESALRLEWIRQQKEKARRAAQRAGALAAARAAVEEELRENARREAEERRAEAAERVHLATQSARQKGLPPVNMARAMKAPPTMRQRNAKKRAQRPDWGQGHAGGRLLRKDAHSGAHRVRVGGAVVV